MIKNKIVVISLIIIVSVAGFIRLFELNQFPPSLNWDEVSHGYNAYSILKTGNDEWGISFPGIFRAYGDYKLPVYIYTLVPFVYLFGLQDFVVRIPSALAGTSMVLGVFFLAKIIGRHLKSINSDLLGIIASFLVAFNPWLFFLSRVAVEANLASALFLWGIISLYWGLDQFKANSKFAFGLVIGALLLGLTLFTYNSYRVFTPLMVYVFIYTNWPVWKIKLPNFFAKFFPKVDLNNPPTCSCHIIAFAVILFMFSVAALQMISPVGLARAANISLIDQGAINYINQLRIDSSFSPQITKLFYNKITYIVPRIIGNYFSYFNPYFWFFIGGDHYQFGIQKTGLLWNFEIVSVVIGLFILLKSHRKHLLIITWLLAAPIAASITRDNPHTLRIITMAPIPSLISALGLVYIFHYVRTNTKLLRGLTIILALFISTNFVTYIRNYFFVYPKEYDYSWQYGNRQLANWITNKDHQYDQIYVTKKLGEPHEFLAFYLKWDPADFQQNKKWQYRDAGTPLAWYWIDQYRQFVFYNDWEQAQVKCEFPQKCLLVTSAMPNGNWNNLSIIYDLNNKPVYFISSSK